MRNYVIKDFALRKPFNEPLYFIELTNKHGGLSRTINENRS